MKLNIWLKEKRGRAKALAAHLSVSNATVSEWANAVKPVPVDRCMPIEALTSGAVTRPDLRDDWETHWPELRKAAEPSGPHPLRRATDHPHPLRRKEDFAPGALPATAGEG